MLGVPGNHDVPLYDVLRRFLSPLARYRRFIDDSLCPFIELPGVAVLGINTARSLTFKDGRINEEQVEFIRETFARTPNEVIRGSWSRIIRCSRCTVGEEVERAIGRQELALDAVEEAGVDMLLAGHAHHASSQDAGELVTRAGGVLVVQAGTATSTRVREQEQSFKRIDIATAGVTVTVHAWTGDDFSRRRAAIPLTTAMAECARCEPLMSCKRSRPPRRGPWRFLTISTSTNSSPRAGRGPRRGRRRHLQRDDRRRTRASPRR